MSEWKPIETAPLKRQIVAGRHDWDGPTVVYWVSDRAKNRDLENWLSPPTHWLDNIGLPPPVQDKGEGS